MLDLHEEEPAATTTTPPTGHSPQRRSILRLGLEVSLIALGVFLGLLSEQWRESSGHRQLALASLRRFRSEFQTNRKAVAAVRDAHIDGLHRIQAYLTADPRTRTTLAQPFRGTSPAFLEYEAWDVALATQSLAYIDSDLAHEIAHVYAVQRQLDGATRDITQVMYAKSGGSNPAAFASFLSSMAVYFGDCNLIEPRLLTLYDEILPKLDRAIGR
jgi:hypothetical protein